MALADFEKTYQEYFSFVQAFLTRMSGNAFLAEELTQETFTQALRHWGEFRGDCTVSTWLCTIAKRLYLNVARKQKHISLDVIPEPMSEEDVTDALIRSDRQMAAHRLLHRLPEPYREVFMLRTFGDLNHAQVGSIFGKSESWARVTYYRARQMLNQMAKEEWHDEE